MEHPQLLWATGFRCLTAFAVKHFFLVSNLNLLCSGLKLLHLVLQVLVKKLSTLLKSPFVCGKAPRRSSWSLLQAEEPQLPQPFLIGEVLQLLDHLCGLLWTCSNRPFSTGLLSVPQFVLLGIAPPRCRTLRLAS